MQNLRNIAIIAHVDHGKTTLVDAMLQQSGTFRDNQQMAERVMDSNQLEKERGITILAKCTSIVYKDYNINIVDTPGHADFGGEVERILSMVDGVVLLVDSSEGVMPQTKFVLRKALAQGLRPIVVINKVDKPDARSEEVINETFDLFVALEASEEQCDFPILYASGRDGWASLESNVKKENLIDLFEKIVDHVKPPVEQYSDGKFRFLATMLGNDAFMGRMLTGKIYSGNVKVGDSVKVLDINSNTVEKVKITKIQTFSGVTKINTETASAGQIVVLAGCVLGTVSNTICAQDVEEPVPSTPIDPPTMSITITVNTSPLAGREGSKVTSSVIKERLEKEAESNIAIKLQQSKEKDSFEVFGRGELQLGVLIETMRREGFELSVSRPRVLFKKDKTTGDILEPIEEVQADVDDDCTGVVIAKIQNKKGEMVDMRPSGTGRTRIIFHTPTRSLIGYQGEFLTDTRGSGILSRSFNSYQKYKGEIKGRQNGVLISIGDGDAVAYALFNLEERGIMFVSPGEKVYNGMIVGEHNRDNDLPVNVLKGKQLTNIRASGSDEAIRLTPAKIMTLEQMISYIEDDELVEVTPKSLRLRKRYLDENERKRNSRKSSDFENIEAI
ncbi:translational GTPase TypA [Candidatus Deianiraea vastatrix]|uniref:Large ribosomal subunit assembly factor BipA n=1 Tax=Candidatus Deianiraea vastatrix TaxID=2163644 RepID=A0A5B8XEM3_9RICK|nr:translational GTPase TypA [Candidatus Deianiraea vastatrix]QED23758.1 GTP-binding protein TypA/BipA [Candidatus Deianiraea vastatrix]